VPQLVLPSILDGLDIGESFLDNVMPHDRINPAPGFKPLDVKALFLSKLKEMSQERINASKDFAYVIEDVMQTKKRIAENKVSLNQAAREKELAEADVQRNERNAERRKRFSIMAAADKQALTFYKLTLEDLDKGAAIHEFDPSAEDGDYMRRAKDETAELDDSPKWPSGMDPVKRESIMVLRDLVDFTETARMAGVLNKSTLED
jgi:carboxyl-terminal processing protease